MLAERTRFGSAAASAMPSGGPGAISPPYARRAVVNELCAYYRRGPQPSGRKQFAEKGSKYFRQIRAEWTTYPETNRRFAL